MIIWIASYPKSGNTWVRSLLASYLFSKDGSFSFDLLNKIGQFPSHDYLKFFLDKEKDRNKKVHEYWVAAQDKINLNNKTNFLKTHNALCTIEKSPFTNKRNTIGVIYIVRDPRNVITSLSNHYEITIEEAFDFFTNEKKIIFESELGAGNFQFIGSWSANYASWKNNKVFPKIIIKYEDLLSNTKETFIKILNFLGEKESVQKNQEKIDKVIENCKFESLRNMEEKEGFYEAASSKRTKKKINFFHLGKKNDWKNLLDQKIEKKIRKIFSNEMKELGYN